MARHRRKSRGLGAVTKKDFVAMADILCETGASKRTIRELGSYFKRQNPRFDVGRFEAATRACKR